MDKSVSENVSRFNHVLYYVCAAIIGDVHKYSSTKPGAFLFPYSTENVSFVYASSCIALVLQYNARCLPITRMCFNCNGKKSS